MNYSSNENLQQYLIQKGVFVNVEGFSQECHEQTQFLSEAASRCVNILEIGFNAGHSAETFLSSNEDVYVTSFDIGEHPYVKHGKMFIDKQYQNRHTLVLGDSLKTIPEYSAKFPNSKFDLIFIDGGHDYNNAYNDIVNCAKLATKDTLLIVDDIVNESKRHRPHTIGPTKAWKDLMTKHVITEDGHITLCDGRGFSWGKYVMP